MWGLSGNHQGYYYATKEQAVERVTYFKRDVEKFEVTKESNVYAAI
jgi:hypothetical protein